MFCQSRMEDSNAIEPPRGFPRMDVPGIVDGFCSNRGSASLMFAADACRDVASRF
jgi:hypothetical protein